MAKKKLSASRKKVNNKPRGKKWSELKPATKRKYKAAGITANKYNAARSRRGEERRVFLGLRPFQISGPSAETLRAKAYRNIRDQFGDVEKFNAGRTHSWLHEISPDHVRKIAEAETREVFDWAFHFDEDFADEEESTRNGDAGRSGGYLFYH